MNYPKSNHLARLTLLAAALALAGCVGLPPKDAAPKLAQVQAADLASAPGRAAWPAANWWTQYGDEQLNGLMQQALAGSPTLAVAQARLAQAVAATGVVEASEGANVSVDGLASRQYYPKNYIYPPPLGGSWRTSGKTDVNASYDFDFWGRNRSAMEAALGQRDAAAAQADAAATALTASVAKAYFQWQALQARLALTQQVTEQRARLQQLEAQRAKAGIVTRESVQPLVADAAAPRQTLVQLNTQIEQARYQLQALTGGHALPPLHAVALPQVAAEVPADLHLDLLARRPDVAAARDVVQASLSQVDAARAAFYPDISISAFLGFSSLQLSSLVNSGSRELGVTPALHLPIFDAGRLKANLQSKRTDVGLAVAQYEQAVQGAVAEVNDAIAHLQGIEAERPALEQQQRARARTVDGARQRAAAGLTDQREVARGELGVLALQDQEISRRAQAVAAQVDLIKALGGGYSAPAAATVAHQ